MVTNNLFPHGCLHVAWAERLQPNSMNLAWTVSRGENLSPLFRSGRSIRSRAGRKDELPETGGCGRGSSPGTPGQDGRGCGESGARTTAAPSLGGFARA